MAPLGFGLVYLSPMHSIQPAIESISWSPDRQRRFLDDPQNYLHVQRQQMIDDAFREHIEIVNYLQRRVDLELTIAFAADFADVFEVRGAKRPRRGTLGAPIVRETRSTSSTTVSTVIATPPRRLVPRPRARPAIVRPSGSRSSRTACVDRRDVRPSAEGRAHVPRAGARGFDAACVRA